jgi:hypothetical protein
LTIKEYFLSSSPPPPSPLAFFPYTYKQITNRIVFLAFYALWARFSQDIRLAIISFVMW